MHFVLALFLAGNALDAFNQKLADATKQMNNAAILELWDENGISLLPSTEPLHGRAAIAKFLDRVMKDLAGAKMESYEQHCSDVEVSGSWASEWCDEHQVVLLPDGKKFDGRGKMLLVLHRTEKGEWKLMREMWNAK